MFMVCQFPYAGVSVSKNYCFVSLMKNLMYRQFKQVTLKCTDYNWQSWGCNQSDHYATEHMTYYGGISGEKNSLTLRNVEEKDINSSSLL